MTHPILQFVTPITPYFLCDHFISTEVDYTNYKYMDIEILDLDERRNNLLKNKNYNDIKNLEIIQIQLDHLDFFIMEVLPIICKNNIKVIIITSQFHFHEIKQIHKTYELLNNDNILLWISQNPIYKHNKYMAFPYGIDHHNIIAYSDFISKNQNKSKTVKLLNQHTSVHDSLPENHIRKKYHIFGKNSGKKLNYIEYLTNISKSEFVISTIGDREDCFRHYECIGLNAIPISNINDLYKDIFEENMIFSNEIEMINMLTSNTVDYNYIVPNRDLLTIDYWRSKINKKVSDLIKIDYLIKCI